MVDQSQFLSGVWQAQPVGKPKQRRTTGSRKPSSTKANSSKRIFECSKCFGSFQSQKKYAKHLASHFNSEPMTQSVASSRYYEKLDVPDSLKRLLEYGGSSEPAFGYQPLGRVPVQQAPKRKKGWSKAERVAFLSLLL